MRKRLSNAFLGAFCCIFLMASCGGSGSGRVASPPSIQASTTQIDFGNVIWDSVSDKIITIQNTGEAALVVGQIAQADPLDAPFSIPNDDCSGKQLAASQTCTLKVRFSPTTQETGLSDTFDIPSNDPNQNSVNVSMSGNGKALRVTINQINTDSCPSSLELLVAITDKNDELVSGLQPDDFVLSENGISTPISSVSPILSPLSVSVALALDVSGSMSDVLSAVQAASKQFVDLLNPGDEAAIFTFAHATELKQPFTTNADDLKSAIDNVSIDTVAGTVLYDALWSAIDNIAAQINNRALIVISDGFDEGSHWSIPGSVKTLTEVINHANENEVTIYTIGLGDVELEAMLPLANNTGGQYFAAPDSSELNSIYLAIRTILDGQYSVQYNSSSSASGPVTLNVVVNFNGLEGAASMQVEGCP